MNIIGTSGYSYSDWVGPFYPEGTKREEMLAYYSKFFNLAELDFTYYQMPGIKVMQGLAAKSPAGFKFAVKAFQGITHAPELSLAERESITKDFLERLDPLQSEGKLACVLLQFPYRFQKNQTNLDLLQHFGQWLPGVELVIEFRHLSWINQESFAFLRDHKYNFCCVDEPALPGLLPQLAVATGPLSYLRFHGRNREKWWGHQHPWERYDYLYSDDELKEWVPKIQRLEQHSEVVMVLFNNCHFGQAARNALRMQQLITGEESLP